MRGPGRCPSGFQPDALGLLHSRGILVVLVLVVLVLVVLVFVFLFAFGLKNDVGLRLFLYALAPLIILFPLVLQKWSTNQNSDRDHGVQRWILIIIIYTPHRLFSQLRRTFQELQREAYPETTSNEREYSSTIL